MTGSDPIDQATIRGYVLSRLRRGEEEEVYIGGRAELYTCLGAKPLAKPLTRPYPGNGRIPAVTLLIVLILSILLFI